ncbi:hypothetical protein A2154_01370, partial [Candidatus Gottesmanbacteria bacterium RBG_16_43_7]
MKPEFPRVMTFVDIETTGLYPPRDRIIEIGILRVESGKIRQTFQSLVNPQIAVSGFITDLTGISQNHLKRAPTFIDISQQVKNLFDKSIFIAHNVRFDYTFIREEFQRIGIPFKAQQLCTVRLFKQLVPGKRRYNLDELIAHFELTCPNRHRAFDDAQVLWNFYTKAANTFPKKTIARAIQKASHRLSLPSGITEQKIDALPQSPGVYIFWGDSPIPLYIGKSKNIRTRVLSHFASDTKRVFEMKLKLAVVDIEAITTAGELSALILESELIKKYAPLYNKLLRYRRRLLLAKKSFTSKNYLQVTAVTVTSIDPNNNHNILGLYKSKRQMTDYLYQTATEYNLCPKLMGLENARGACFHYQLQSCRGACIGKEPAAAYNLRFMNAFKTSLYKPWPFPGPVLVCEKGEAKSAGYIIDKWCLLGKAQWDENGSLDISKPEYKFDADVYKILVRFLTRSKSDVQIRNIEA